jgi:hypothetical protein
MTQSERSEMAIVALEKTIMDAHKAMQDLCERHAFATGGGITLADTIREIDLELWELKKQL